MTESKATYTTGADQDGHDLRRRNVPEFGQSNGDVTHMPESDDNDKKAKKVCRIGRAYKRSSIVWLSYLCSPFTDLRFLGGRFSNQSCRYWTSMNFLSHL